MGGKPSNSSHLFLRKHESFLKCEFKILEEEEEKERF